MARPARWPSQQQRKERTPLPCLASYCWPRSALAEYWPERCDCPGGRASAPAIATMLADGHKHRKEGWLHVYRPLYILKGMGEHAKVALPDVIKALDDQYGAVAKVAAEVLENLGPAAKGAVPDLLRVWEKSRKIPGRPGATKALAAAIQKIDPEAAEKAGIK